MDTENIQRNIEEQNKIETAFKLRMNRAIMVAMSLITIMYLIVVIPFLSAGITHITMHVVGFMAMILVFPILTFFGGMWLVWKKKFFPNNETDEE